MPALESDSEEEESARNDNLNCAILNDSFLISPVKSYRDEGSSKEFSAPKANNCDTTSDMSLLAHFNNMDLKSPTKNQKPLTQIPETNGICTTEKETEEHKQPEVPASIVKNSSSLEAQFATPQIRSFSVQRRPRDLCSTQSQKTKSAIVNEFRSQKVLFQTPMAMSRAPMSYTNDSISLSLCDTINECGTPSTSEKTPQSTDEKQANDVIRSKKSLEGAFLEASSEQAPRKDASKCSAITMRDKETIVHINDSNYVIIQKLGCGGSSSVYLAKREDNKKECALKVNSKSNSI